MAIGDNNIVSAASDTELEFLEIRIIKIEDSGIAARISSGADIAAITKERNDIILATDKVDPMAITDKIDPLLVTDKNIIGVEVPTALEVYSIPRDSLEVNIPTTLEVYNILGNTLEVSSKYFNYR